ncbi:hypothetical protein KJ693_00690, partial [bacterium]|nr:hypothetical protein [bacterium]
KWPEWIANEIEEDKEVTTTDVAREANLEPQDNLQSQETTNVSSTIHPKSMETIISNGKPAEDADRMRWLSKWNGSKLGDPKFWIDKGEDGLGYVEYSNDWRTESEKDGDKELWSREVVQIRKLDNTSPNPDGELLISSALIDNNGNIMTKDRLKEMGIFEALEKTGFEYRVESDPNSRYRLLLNPIDIVFTADIIIAALKELAGAVTAATIEAK